MSGGQRLKIRITAADEASAIFAKVNKAVGGLDKPAADADAKLKRLADSPALTSLGKSIDGIGTSARNAVGAIGSLLPGIGTLAGIGTIAGGAAFISDWSNRAAAIGRSAMAIGDNVAELQELQGAYRRVGGTAEEMTANVHSLAREMRNALVGDNDLALSLANQYGISLKRLEDGSFDTKSAMLKIADVYKSILAKNGPQSAEAFANAFGLNDLGILLRRGSDGMTKLMAETRATGVVMSGEATNASIKFQKSLVDLEDTIGGVGNAIGEWLMPKMTLGIEALNAWIKNPELMMAMGDAVIDNALGRKPGAGRTKPSSSPEAVIIPLRPQGTAAAVPTPPVNFSSPSSIDAVEDSLQQSRPGATASANGTVSVDIRLHGAPHGTVATVQQSGNVDANARVESSMPQYGP